MTETTIFVSPKTYFSFETIVPHLKSLYLREREYDTVLNVTSDIKISYYGLILTYAQLKKEKEAILKFKAHLKEAKEKYASFKEYRAQNNRTWLILNQNVTKEDDSIKMAIHRARNSLTHQEIENWYITDFVLNYNGGNYLFNPFEVGVYTKLKKQVREGFQMVRKVKMNLI